MRNTINANDEIVGMLKALRSVLKDKHKAEQILRRYWRNKIQIIWTVEDVHRAANECEVALSNSEAIEVLQYMHAHLTLNSV
jgi:hypothetical protein